MADVVRSEVNPWASSRARAWLALVLGLASFLVMPASIVVARQSRYVDLMDAAYGIPVGFVVGVLATGMARRAQRNLEWLGLDGRGSGIARLAVILGILGIALAVMCAVSVGVYEGVLYYQHHYR
jgi:peptidoglycan/LPS O-acetylase OafA/YrhL